jgi:hypothetical protein
MTMPLPFVKSAGHQPPHGFQAGHTNRTMCSDAGKQLSQRNTNSLYQQYGKMKIDIPFTGRKFH